MSFVYLMSANAQEYEVRFDHISVKEGLSQSTVYSIYQDSKGFMWFGTQNSGLNRFDGYNFKIYRHNPLDTTTISSDDISDIIQTSDSSIWIGTWGGGLEKFNPIYETFTHYRHNPEDPTSISYDRAQNLLVDKDGILWIGTAGGGLNKYIASKNSFISYQNNPYDAYSISNNRIWSMAEDTNGYIWIGTDDGLNRFNKTTGKFKRFMYKPDDTNTIRHKEVRNVYVDKSGKLWVGTASSLDEFDEKNDMFTHYYPTSPTDIKLYSKEINKIFEDHNHVLWVGTQMDGLCILDRKLKNWTKYKHDPQNSTSLSYNDVRDIFEDHSGNLWVSTRGGGLNKMDLKAQKFRLFKQDPYNVNSLSENRIRSLLEDHNGNIWIGTDGGGINIYNPKTKQYEHKIYSPLFPDKIDKGVILCLYEDYLGNFWVGYDISGVDVFNNDLQIIKRFKAYDQNNYKISHRKVNDVVGNKKGLIWIATRFGLCEYNYVTDKVKIYYNDPTDDNSLINNNVIDLLYNSDGLLWIGTEYGISVFNPKTTTFNNFKNDPKKLNSLSSDNINCLHEDGNGNIWIGTTKGLNRFDKKTKSFKSYTIKDGLPTDDIYAILSDTSGNIWYSSFAGLTLLNLEDGSIKNYDVFDGLQNNMFSKKAAIKTRQGEFYFGGIDGFNTFYPHEILHNPVVPKLVFTDFQIYNKSVNQISGSPLHKSITYTKEIYLNYKQNVFTIWFSALEYTVTDKNRYAYKMEGFEEDWNYVSTERMAHYMNLSPGKYTFRVKASNNDGLWNEEGIALIIHIKPPFWKTLWFILIEIFGVFISIIAFVIIRERNLRRYNKILEEKVSLRTLEIEHQKEEIIAQADELRKLSIVASETDNAVIITDNKGMIEWINEGFTRLLGYTLAQLFKEKGNNLIATSNNKSLNKILNRVRDKKESVTYTSVNTTRDNKEIWLQTTLTPILDEHGEVLKIIAIDSNITKIKKAEETIVARNKHIAEQRDQILKQNNEILASIMYASRIQKAILPPLALINEILPQHFILNKPRDIVSGDFYWATKINDEVIVTVADCTGHGVPGALMSMIAVSFLNKIVNEKKITDPNLILDRLKQNIITSLHQSGKIYESNDGMDIALINLNLKTFEMTFAGAINPVIYFHKNKLFEIKGDRMAVSYNEDIDRKYALNKVQMHKGDMVYLFSDGYSDQFGGKASLRFLKKNFKLLLQKINSLNMEQQHQELEDSYFKWRGKNKQVDDILVLGFRI